jgi:transposase-like protein
MAKAQKTYTREFKEEAVRLVQTSGKPIAQIARELGLSDSAIHGWRKELAEQVELATIRQTSATAETLYQLVQQFLQMVRR